MRKLLALVLVAGLAATFGCKRPATTADTGRPPKDTGVTPKDTGVTPKDTGIKPKPALKVDRETITVEAGKEETIKLTGVPTGEKATASVDPSGKGVDVVVENDKVIIKADKTAKGDYTVTVKAADAQAKIKVTIK